MTSEEVFIIKDPGKETADRIKTLFTAMYEEFIDMGLLLKPAEHAAEIWFRSVENTLGRFGVLVAARKNGKIIGFAHGSLLMAPAYLEAGKTGVITHVFVDKSHRKSGIAQSLVAEMEGWFRQMNVHSIELQVLTKNHPGKTFWEKLGYGQELLQYRKMF